MSYFVLFVQRPTGYIHDICEAEGRLQAGMCTRPATHAPTRPPTRPPTRLFRHFLMVRYVLVSFDNQCTVCNKQCGI